MAQILSLNSILPHFEKLNYNNLVNDVTERRGKDTHCEGGGGRDF